MYAYLYAHILGIFLMSDTTILEQIRDGITALAQGKSMLNSATGSGSSGGVDPTKLISAVTQTTTAFLGVSSAGHELQGALSGVAGVLPGKLGSATTSFINGMEEARQANIQNAKQGIGGLALFDLPAKTREIGLGVEEYRQILSRSGNALNGLGGTAQSGSERLLKFGNEIQTTTLGKNLIDSGVIAKDEFQKLATLSQYGTKANMDDAAQRKKSAEAAAMFTDEIIKSAAITGKSRDTIAAELEERLKSPVILAQMNQMTEDQRQSFIRSQAQLSGMGNTVQDLSATLGTGGRLSREQNMQLSAMGPAAGEFARASRMAATATDEASKKEAAAAMESAKAKINEYQSSAQFANIMKSATPEVAKYYQEQYKENQLRGRQAATERDTGTQGTAALAAQRTQAGRVINLGQTEAGQADPNQAAQRTITAAQNAAQANTAGLIKSMQGLETQFGTNEKAAQSLRKYMDLAFGGGSVQERKEFYDKQAADIIKTIEGGATGASKRTEGATKPGEALPEAPKKKHAFGGISDVAAIFGEAGPEAAVPLPDGRRIPVDLNIGDALAKMQQAMNSGMANATAAMAAIPATPRQTSTESSSGGSMNDLLKAMQELNKNIMRMASNTEDMVTHTKNTAKATKAASGARA